MTEQQHPITPPPELIRQWRNTAPPLGLNRESWIATEAARWGADQELEACCKALEDIWDNDDVVTQGDFLQALRAARRPKPPSLAEQAIAALDQADKGLSEFEWQQRSDTIRAALGRLQELESKQ